jgi:hypothetical protein
MFWPVLLSIKITIGDGSSNQSKSWSGSEQSSILQLVLNDGYYYEDRRKNTKTDKDAFRKRLHKKIYPQYRYHNE